MKYECSGCGKIVYFVVPDGRCVHTTRDGVLFVRVSWICPSCEEVNLWGDMVVGYTPEKERIVGCNCDAVACICNKRKSR